MTRLSSTELTCFVHRRGAHEKNLQALAICWGLEEISCMRGLLAGSAGLRRPQRIPASFFFGVLVSQVEPTHESRGQVETLRGDGKTKRPETYGWQVGDEKTTGGVASLKGSESLVLV